MRLKKRPLLCCLLCAALALTPALAEEAAPEMSPQPPIQETAEEFAISPAYPVPDYVNWLLDVARGELGYTEDYTGATKYGAWTGFPTAEWCAEFLCWCVHQVDQSHGTQLLNAAYPYYTGTNTGRDWFLSQGRYIARKGTVPGWGSQWFKGEKEVMAPNSYIPQPGDWVFFSTGSSGDTVHVSMVEYCAYDAEGQVRLHVIEGNSPFAANSSAVVENDYPLDYWSILGYGTVRDLADIALRFGNDGAKVKALQQDLVSAGLLEAQYTTGRYGAITTEAIKVFQRRIGAVETGIANMETQLALHEYVSLLPPPQASAP